MGGGGRAACGMWVVKVQTSRGSGSEMLPRDNLSLGLHFHGEKENTG